MVSQAIKRADQPRAQWYWKSNSDPWATNGNEEWTKYSDIESAIIEEAFNQKNRIKLAELDNYSINLNESIQISKSDPDKQRQIKRVLTSRNESQAASSLSQLLVTSSWSHEHRCDESGMLPRGKEHPGIDQYSAAWHCSLAASSLSQLSVTSWSSYDTP
ncbi:unnamed protein product [Didymodactylos carnosus]|uniref:WWE domain-containing protein n=1 Tax=Didymodactylos carnosus TaxID=1234261 RepID=A0A814U3I3_9BILA|nr:unnamed protein product [Didymodactylos carnosus]CAF1169409.1 unnamed protein product [Didymodactylos carnosus]CAF3820104.1 unnamed protein product [Didymodactylos carnosus]CAF3933121.1 unnamed protein product [Didymodactylos carnosus]